MSLFLFLIIVLSLSCGSAAPREVALLPCLVASAGLILAWGLLAKSAASFALARVRCGVGPLAAAQGLERQLEALRWLGIVAALICLLGFGLAGAVQLWPVFAQSLLLQSVALLAPGLLIIASTLWAEHQYGVAMGYTAAGFLRAVAQVLTALVRFSGWLLAPILVMLAIADLLALMPWSDQVPAGVSLAALTILTIPVLVPWLAKRMWTTAPLAGDEHRQIGELVAAAGLPGLDVRLWDTGMRSPNAVVVGFFAPLRSLLLTDRLVHDLPADQLRLIILHEVAHIRRHHIWLRMLSVLPGWLLAAMVLHVGGTGPVLLLLSNAVAIGGTLLMLRLSGHETEFEADRVACELATQIGIPPYSADRSAHGADSALCIPSCGTGAAMEPRAAAAALSAALRRVTSGADAGRAAWLHPSVDARCRRLELWAERVSQSQHQPADPLAVSTPFSLPTI
jgi:Zn-dependent protease with chaperone function